MQSPWQLMADSWKVAKEEGTVEGNKGHQRPLTFTHTKTGLVPHELLT